MPEEQAPDFLMDESNKEQDSCDLQRLSDMVSSYTQADSEVSELEERLKEAKAVRTRLSQETIPEYLNQYGLSELKLTDGRKVIVKDDVSVTVKDKSLFHNFLKTRKEDSIIKFVVSFERMSPEKREKLFDFFLKEDYDCESEEKVHSSTQKKYFKELLGIGKEPEEIQQGLSTGTMVQPTDVEKFAKVFPYKVTKIK
ncbi:MAG: hypothetical protein GWN64_07765 [Candidatus Thorarchaeota archaeon]|nr:hypothetical protein [Candidatus Thorarchaeota archaeon]